MGVLNRELFEQGNEAYGQAALDLVTAAATGQLRPMPQIAKDRSLALLTRVADAKILRNHWGSLGEAVGVAYRFASSETWEGLDRGHARELVDEGLERVRQQHIQTAQPDPLVVSDPTHRVHYAMLGLVGEHPTWERLREYVFGQPAYQRLVTLDDLHLQIGLQASGAKKRHAELFMQAQLVAWRAGHALGILDVLGEVAPD